MMHYARPIRITQDCLACHGEPAGEVDPTGADKEGKRNGDVIGAFSVEASTEQLVQTANSNSLVLFLLSFLTLLASAGAVYVVVQRLVIRPLSRSVDLAHRIASNDLSADDLVVESKDEIGD
jgi:methyl-accepting chemotaxis protein